MNAATAEAVTHDIPATALYALPMLGLALRRIEAIRAGQPVPQSPEADALPTDIDALIAFCIRRANDAQDVVQTAFDALSNTSAAATHPVAMLLDEIL